MKGANHNIAHLILLVIVVLIVRPVIVYSSSVLQAAFSYEIKAYGHLKIARKRKQNFHLPDIFKEQESSVVPSFHLPSVIKTWLRTLIALLTVFFTSFYIKARKWIYNPPSTGKDYHIRLSVLRI